MDNTNFINSKTLAEKLDLKVTAIQRLVREGRIPAYKIDRKQYLFKFEEVSEIITNNRVN